MTDLRVIGLDPGPTLGLVVIDYELVGTPHAALRRVEAVQCSAGVLYEVFGSFLRTPGWVPLVQVEGSSYAAAPPETRR